LNPEHSIKLINEIENKFLVDEWKIDGVRVWPLIRINENWSRINSIHNAKQTRK